MTEIDHCLSLRVCVYSKAISQAEQRKNTRSSVKVNKTVEPTGEAIQADGTSLVSELKRRVVIDAGIWHANFCFHLQHTR